METRTKGRIYVSVGGDQIQKITFFDSENERIKTIELDHPHKGLTDGHVHHGYFHNEYDTEYGGAMLSEKDRKIVDKVKKIFDNYKRKRK